MSDKVDEAVAEVITAEVREDRVMSKEDKLERDRMLTEMNRNHAFIGNYGGKAVVSDLVPVADNPGKQRFEFVSVDSIRVRYCNKFVPGSESRAARVALGTWWVNHPYRREYAGVVFEPNGEDTVWLHQKHYLNLWQGWPIEPVQGDWSLMRAHIAMVLADGDPKLEEYILRWFAWAVQNPGKPAEVALVFRGGKGSGKGTLTKVLKRMFGVHGIQISDRDQLTGKFNAHMHQCILLIADEAYWAGDRKAEGALKRIITEPTLAIEPKGVDVFEVLNLLHLIITANDKWVVPASSDERRFAVADVSDRMIGNQAYFTALNAEIEGGGVAAMLYDLLRMDLEGWHPRQVYENAALRAQQARSLHGFDAFFEHLLQEGEIPGAMKRNPRRVAYATLFEKFQRFDQVHNRYVTEPDFIAALDENGIVKARSSTVRLREFPPLREARQKFAERFHGEWEWREDLEEWTVTDVYSVFAEAGL